MQICSLVLPFCISLTCHGSINPKLHSQTSVDVKGFDQCKQSGFLLGTVNFLHNISLFIVSNTALRSIKAAKSCFPLLTYLVIRWFKTKQLSIVDQPCLKPACFSCDNALFMYPASNYIQEEPGIYFSYIIN